MKEVIYKYNNSGKYYTEDNTAFGEDSHTKFIVEPHQFSIAVGGEVLRQSSFDGCVAVASHTGKVVFYNNENNAIGESADGERLYKSAVFQWNGDLISVHFGQTQTVDYYPNCDGEYDRWGTEWVTERSVTLNLKNNSIEIK